MSLLTLTGKCAVIAAVVLIKLKNFNGENFKLICAHINFSHDDKKNNNNARHFRHVMFFMVQPQQQKQQHAQPQQQHEQ